jgi:hypothetical protein
MSSPPKFTVLSSWNDSSNFNKFNYIFILEFTDYDDIKDPYDQVNRLFKKNKKSLEKHLENYGTKDIDWTLGKHRGNYTYGSALILRFKDKFNALAFMLEYV